MGSSLFLLSTIVSFCVCIVWLISAFILPANHLTQTCIYCVCEILMYDSLSVLAENLLRFFGGLLWRCLFIQMCGLDLLFVKLNFFFFLTVLLLSHHILVELETESQKGCCFVVWYSTKLFLKRYLHLVWAITCEKWFFFLFVCLLHSSLSSHHFLFDFLAITFPWTISSAIYKNKFTSLIIVYQRSNFVIFLHNVTSTHSIVFSNYVPTEWLMSKRNP